MRRSATHPCFKSATARLLLRTRAVERLARGALGRRFGFVRSGKHAGEFAGLGRPALQHVRDLVRHGIHRRVRARQQDFVAARRAFRAKRIEQARRVRTGERPHVVECAAETLLELLAVRQRDRFADGACPRFAERVGFSSR